MNDNIKISPIFYQGCKKKMIKNGMIDLFPKNIETFYDLFGGSGIVSMNTKAEKYIINDINKNLYDLYTLFYYKNDNDIIVNIENRIKEFDLATIRTKRNVFFDLETIERYKKSYYNFRNFYNENKNVLDLYILTIFSFSQQMRFNNKTNDFNMPCGNDCFSDKNKTYIKNGCDFFKKDNVFMLNESYNFLKEYKLKKNDFVYLDPPYLGTTATYNENGCWTKKHEYELYTFLEELNKKNIKFGMSNSFSSKGKENKILKDWCKKNNFGVYHFNVNYSSMGKGNSKNDEVYICNYKAKKEQNQVSIFDL